MRRSTNLALWVLPTTMLAYYSYCRHKIATDRFKFQQIKSHLIEYVDQKGKEEEE